MLRVFLPGLLACFYLVLEIDPATEIQPIPILISDIRGTIFPAEFLCGLLPILDTWIYGWTERQIMRSHRSIIAFKPML